jgi:hypothetical protein
MVRVLLHTTLKNRAELIVSAMRHCVSEVIIVQNASAVGSQVQPILTHHCTTISRQVLHMQAHTNTRKNKKQKQELMHISLHTHIHHAHTLCTYEVVSAVLAEQRCHIVYQLTSQVTAVLRT